MRRLLNVMLSITVAFPLIGCGGDTGRESVSGRVTLDGEAVDEGAISFSPLPGTDGPIVGANIDRGTYEIPNAQGPMTGRYRVEIRWPRPTGKQVLVMEGVPESGMRDELAEAIPAKYNTESELEIEIRVGRNEHNFELTTDSE